MTLSAFIARLVFALPPGVLRSLAGGGYKVDGVELDPHIALMAKQAERRPPATSLPVNVVRAGMKSSFALIDSRRVPGVSVNEIKVPAADGSPLDARLYAPPGSSGGEGLIVYFHQGGCVLGGVWACDAWCSILAAEAGCRVLNVDYRHAPEHRFPAAVDDAVGAFQWAIDHAPDLSADPARIGVGGDSAGGYLSAVICQARKRTGDPQPLIQ
ncbi:alpha/beta hydrolase fold domain-containing protein [bacterium]|nr:alpha/beta hydrolase fold domain-containing protein [bacterium]